MEILEIISGSAVLVLALAFFLKTLHSDIKENIKATTRNSTDILLLQQQSNSEIKELRNLTTVHLNTLTESINHFVKASEKSHQKLEDKIKHMNGNVKMHNSAVEIMFAKFIKDNPDTNLN